MKKLILIRHGKANWGRDLFDDFNRPLELLGKTDAELMAEKILKKQKAPDAFFISKAERASETALIIKSFLNLQQSTLHFEKILYTFEWHNVLTFIRDISDNYNTVWIVGHNPALTELANYLSFAKKIFNLPTAGIAILNLDILTWEETRKDCGILENFHYPKEFKLHPNN